MAKKIPTLFVGYPEKDMHLFENIKAFLLRKADDKYKLSFSFHNRDTIEYRLQLPTLTLETDTNAEPQEGLHELEDVFFLDDLQDKQFKLL